MDLVLTVIALVAGVLAIVPRSRRLDLQLRFQPFDWGIAGLAVLITLFLQFYDFFGAHISRLPPKECWPTGLTPANTIYVVVLFFAVILGIRLYFAKLTRRKAAAYRDLIEELYWSGSYGELLALLQAHLRSLFRIYVGDYFLPRLRARLNPLRFLHVSLLLSNELNGGSGSPVSPWVRALRNWFRDSSTMSRIRSTCFRAVSSLERTNTSQQSAAEIVRGIFLAPRFLTALAQTRPYLGLSIVQMSWSRFERVEFLDAFLKELLRDSHSVFFREIENNQNVSHGRYEIPETNRILYYFLSDVRIAKELGVYKPIGDFLISYLEDLTRHPSEDSYNRASSTEFEKVDAWRSPLFAGVQFFDIMVREALFQNMQWHMWLYYMPHVVEGIVRNYRVNDPLADPAYEFPTRYSNLLYQIFSNIRGWILALEDVPEGQANVVLQSQHLAFDENENIPKCSIKALSQCLFLALDAPNLGDRTKRALSVLVFNCYFDLRIGGTFDSYAALLASAIFEGEPYSKTNSNYRARLLDFFLEERQEYLITKPRDRVRDLGLALGFQEEDEEGLESEDDIES